MFFYIVWSYIGGLCIDRGCLYLGGILYLGFFVLGLCVLGGVCLGGVRDILNARAIYLQIEEARA